MHKATLYTVVLVAGAVTMATEMAGSRLLAPYFGNSLLVWANLIGLILIYLTVGYYWGGRLADRRPYPGTLYAITLLASFLIAVIPFIAKPVMKGAVVGIEQVSAGAFLGSFLAVVLLFALPITLLGTVAPFAIRLAMERIDRAGNVAGALYALSTLGSILGTFSAVLLFIPLLGARRTMLAFALALAVISVIGLARKRALLVPLLIAGLLALPPGTIKPTPGLVYEGESPYQYVQVVEKEGRRTLHLNEGWAIHSIIDENSPYTGGIWDAFLFTPLFLEQPPRQVLIIGNAGGTIAKGLIRRYPGVQIDGVEIDPLVSEVGRKYFDMNEPSLTVTTADGRAFLARQSKRYDLVIVDAYRQPYIPFYLTTREFFSEVGERLAPGGIVAINVGKTPGDSPIVDAIGATMKSVFTATYNLHPATFNDIIVGTTTPQSNLERLRGGLRGTREEPLKSLAVTIDRNAEEMTKTTPVLTDDHAPVEWMIDQMIVRYASSGGE